MSMIDIKGVLFLCLCSFSFVGADYVCVENTTDVHLRFCLVDAHYDVYEYQFSPKDGGLGDRRLLESGSGIDLLPGQRIMLRTMYSYDKSGGHCSLKLVGEADSIVFSNDSFDDFELSDSLNVKVLSRLEVLDDDFSGLADKVYRIVKSTSAPSSPGKMLEYSSGRPRSSSDPLRFE